MLIVLGDIFLSINHLKVLDKKDWWLVQVEFFLLFSVKLTASLTENRRKKEYQQSNNQFYSNYDQEILEWVKNKLKIEYELTIIVL